MQATPTQLLLPVLPQSAALQRSILGLSAAPAPLVLPPLNLDCSEMAGPGSLVLLVDVADAAVLGAAQAGLRRFGAALCLQPGDGAAAGALAAPPPAAPRPVLGLANLARPPGAPKPVVQVRCRPSPYQLREFHSAVGRLQPAAGITASEAAKALLQVVGVVSQDAACAAAGPRRALLYLTDRTDYEPADFSPTLEVGAGARVAASGCWVLGGRAGGAPAWSTLAGDASAPANSFPLPAHPSSPQLCRGKGVHIELLFMSAAEAAEGGGGGDAAADALAAAWGAAEASFAHLSVTVVPGASRLSFEGLATSLLQRWAPPPALPVSLAFKAPLLGSIRALALAAAPEVRPLAQSVRHAALCPCHRSPAAWAGAAALCAVTGAALDPRQCGRDERTVQVGAQPGGALHLAAPFNIGSAGGGGGGATLNVLGRVKVGAWGAGLARGVEGAAAAYFTALLPGAPAVLPRPYCPADPPSQADQANPALLFGVPLLLGPGAGAGERLKVVHDGELADTSQAQLLGVVVGSLRCGWGAGVGVKPCCD